MTPLLRSLVRVITLLRLGISMLDAALRLLVALRARLGRAIWRRRPYSDPAREALILSRLPSEGERRVWRALFHLSKKAPSKQRPPSRP